MYRTVARNVYQVSTVQYSPGGNARKKRGSRESRVQISTYKGNSVPGTEDIQTRTLQ
jgi:hypothetical protein